MTPETLEFCKMFFNSPIVAAIAGGILGVASTRYMTLKQFQHNSEENKKAWERQEARYQEERIFEKKAKAYEDFFELFDSLVHLDEQRFDKILAPTFFKIALYSPEHIRLCIRDIYNMNLKIMELETKNQDHSQESDKLSKLFHKMRDLMIEDIQLHIVSKCDQDKK